jgi:ribosomal protein S18 acetylase RimI-like enzyme
MMTDSEPWRTLRQAYDVSLEIVIDPSRENYLAWVDGEVAGFVILHMQGVFNGYIQAVCVALEWRNRGIGSQLLRFAEERIFRETPDAFLCVSPLSRDALRWYKRLGYEVIGESRDSEILLRKRMG